MGKKNFRQLLGKKGSRKGVEKTKSPTALEVAQKSPSNDGSLIPNSGATSPFAPSTDENPVNVKDKKTIGNEQEPRKEAKTTKPCGEKGGEKGKGKEKKREKKKKEVKKEKKHKGKKKAESPQKNELRLAEGALIEKNKDCYLIVRKLGKGAFAAVYEARRSSDRAEVAIKVEFFNNKKEHRIPQEWQIYKEIDTLYKQNPNNPRIKHFLRFHDHLQNDAAEFLILQKAGESIDSISSKYHPTLCTAVQWAIQSLESLEHLHLLGFIHRDIKTANFIVSHDKRILYVIDFGMSVPFVRDPKKMPKTSVYEFIGTAKYASRTAHNGMPQSRRDDVESWLFLSMEFYNPEILPWRNSGPQRIPQKKQQFVEGSEYRELFRLLPRGYQAIVGCVRETTVMEEPNYAFYYEVLHWIAEDNKLNLNRPFEWNPLPKDKKIFLLPIKGAAIAEHKKQKKERKTIESILRKQSELRFSEAKANIKTGPAAVAKQPLSTPLQQIQQTAQTQQESSQLPSSQPPTSNN